MVEVRIPTEKLRADKSATGRSLAILAALRAESIPVTGSLFIEGIEHGRLVLSEDAVFGELIYQWFPEGEDA